MTGRAKSSSSSGKLLINHIPISAGWAGKVCPSNKAIFCSKVKHINLQTIELFFFSLYSFLQFYSMSIQCGYNNKVKFFSYSHFSRFSSLLDLVSPLKKRKPVNLPLVPDRTCYNDYKHYLNLPILRKCENISPPLTNSKTI